MDLDAVPQDDNLTLGGHRKAVYARDPSGRIRPVTTTGWDVEELVTTQAADALRRQAEQARQAALAGLTSPLAYWMFHRRMDLALLAQSTGLWQWRVRRHLEPKRFARLNDKLLGRYAEALGLPVATIRRCPDQPPSTAAAPLS